MRWQKLSREEKFSAEFWHKGIVPQRGAVGWLQAFLSVGFSQITAVSPLTNGLYWIAVTAGIYRPWRISALPRLLRCVLPLTLLPEERSHGSVFII